MLFDILLEELKTYRPPRNEASDFDTFWEPTLAETQELPLNTGFTPIDFGMRTVEAFDVTFNSFVGQPINGWFLLPRQRSTPLTWLVNNVRYRGVRCFPTDWFLWSSTCFAHSVMNIRGQGNDWKRGDTSDPELEGSSLHHPSIMTQGILDHQINYYRRVFVDGMQAVVTAKKSYLSVVTGRVALTSSSQGGGIALAVVGLDSYEFITMSGVRFLWHYRRATEITDTPLHVEISRYCQTHRNEIDVAFKTLSYFDGVNFTTRCRAQALFLVVRWTRLVHLLLFLLLTITLQG